MTLVELLQKSERSTQGLGGTGDSDTGTNCDFAVDGNAAWWYRRGAFFVPPARSSAMRKCLLAIVVTGFLAALAREESIQPTAPVQASGPASQVLVSGRSRLIGRFMSILIRPGMRADQLFLILGPRDKPLPTCTLAGGKYIYMETFSLYGLGIRLFRE
jgi:hypothetical protein